MINRTLVGEEFLKPTIRKLYGKVENKQFVYQNCFSSNNKLRIPESTGIMNLQERNAPPFRGLPLDGCCRASGPPH